MAKTFYWLLPFYLISFVTSTAGTEIFGWSLFTLFLVQFISDTKKLGFKESFKNLKTGIDIPILFFGFWVLLGSYIIFQDINEVTNTFRNNRWILLFFALSYLMKKYFKKDYQKHLNTIMVAVCIAGLYGIFQMFTGIDFVRGQDGTHIVSMGNFFRASGFHSIFLTYAYCLGMAGLFAYSYLLQSSPSKKSSYILSILATICMIGGIVASSTRGAWIALFVAFIITTSLFNIKKAAIAFVAAILVACSLLLIPTIQERAISIIDVKDGGSNSQRMNIWKANWAMFKEHPILGVGLEKNKLQLNDYLTKIGLADTIDGHTYHAHNDFLQTLSGTGLPGTIAWIWFCLYFLILSYRLFKNSKDLSLRIFTLGAFASQLYMHVGGLTQVNFTDNEVTHIVVFIWSILLAIQHQRRENAIS